MKYRSVLVILILAVIFCAPGSANLKKIDVGTPVFIGETGLDISSALNGCRQIAWWPAGNTTDDPPGKVLDIGDDLRSYTIRPAVFSNYTGTWYSYDKKPSVEVFEVKKPEFSLSVWDLDHDRDVTGQSVPVSTRITYRIDTNLYPVFNKYQRPEINNLDSFMEVTLTGPTGNHFNTIYTGSAGLGETLVLPVDTVPSVRESPYYWNNGGRWNRTAKSGEGALLYPPGTYTFSASQNLNGMRSYYSATDPAITTGPRTITFVADVPVTGVPSPVRTIPLVQTTRPAVPETTQTTVPHQPPATTPAVKTTWTSAPLPFWITAGAICFACLLFLSTRRRLA